ncbi:leucine-rich repeat and transmembrane domain-containing protein 1-like isoform X1 [Sphaerodactylus townsendi]|uniref:leucine-rich repeat and transmembrane domain-containing protein 1-like isoform X1 n=2 Tax=Sphaerodactylus townsendi TaxID=933632 RepID=UPI002025DBF8|nr:leucine-rich repeat and transmembrane domain-containing protein 1-like isoform X1 [Sphaerodactylus townsendi]
MGSAGEDHKRWTVILFGGILLSIDVALGTLEDNCNCSTTTSFQEFQAAVIPEMCCLNFTGYKIGSLDWSLFNRVASLRELYLSNCSISDIFNASDDSSTLEILYLDHNQLKRLPGSFLRNAPNLRVIELKNNQLQGLPESFLKASDQIKEIHLDFNNLSSLPSEIFKPSLFTLGLANNSWDCTCTLLGSLERYLNVPFNSEVVCSSPKHFSGRNMKTIPKQELCQTYKLTALFICLPLVALLTLITWCFCKQKKETGYALRDGKECQLATVESNGAKKLGEHNCYNPCELSAVTAAENEKNIFLRNQVLLKPSTALLGSSRDLYEEVEIKLGASDDSFIQAKEGSLDQEILGAKELMVAEEGFLAAEPEAETVSVTDVLKDSADREKLYMNHSVDYYNLVPGIELEDSDHMEYENVDLC